MFSILKKYEISQQYLWLKYLNFINMFILNNAYINIIL